MPKNVPPELEEKFKSCKEKVMASGQDENAAYGICYTSVVEGKSLPEAHKSYYEQAIKSGRMISSKNRELLMQVMEIVKQLVPDDEPKDEPAEDMPMMGKTADEMLVSYGSAVKSVDGKPSGFAVRFGGSDLSGDDFDKSTNYGFAGEASKKVDILFHHAQPIETKSGKLIQVTDPIGHATLKMSDDGILIEDAILYNAEKYSRYLDKLGWSTGAAAHSVIRDGGHIKQWQIAEVSLTPIPAEPRNMVAAKSLEGVKADIELDEPEIDYAEIGREVGKAIASQLRQNAG